MLVLAPAGARAATLEQWALQQAALCTTAIAAAEARAGIPRGLLLAIAKVESGRPVPPQGELAPWPWTTDAEGSGAFYDTRDAAVAGARAALRRSRNLDVGCMQISLLHHPGAFPTLEDAFDPALNVAYAARFLIQLQAGPASGDWGIAAGMYHSQTAFRAAGYRARVEAVMAGMPLLRNLGPVPLFRRAVQHGPIRIDLQDGAVRLVRFVPSRTRGGLRCQPLPGGAIECR